ncbi:MULTISPECIES: hypothetical protein [Sphingobium]|uniref:hypothetical protein n=1 Tax=Sphingobium TaxID=165695 RepID=UPI0017F8B639|nr:MULTISPECIES: hypothetical protein [Sphingobium]MCW2363363.1 hypothetical protein [Sphingobium sp. B10D3B]MCW2403238.1 hypothetical protein [Sphingobium sp. B10D7B]MCW2410217.1 hypothetical protein [Sphingobium xanthum]
MIVEQIARIVADFFLFLNMTDEELLDLDVSVLMMEDMAARLQDLDKAFLRELVDAFPVIASEYSGEAQKLVLDIPYSFYLEETLAAGDPVRLAELEALRDARD